MSAPRDGDDLDSGAAAEVIEIVRTAPCVCGSTEPEGDCCLPVLSEPSAAAAAMPVQLIKARYLVGTEGGVEGQGQGQG